MKGPAYWRTALSVGAEVATDTRQAGYSLGANATVYLKPLHDDAELPLELLVFAQHPGLLTASASKTTDDGVSLGAASELYLLGTDTALRGGLGVAYTPEHHCGSLHGDCAVGHY